MYRQIRVHRDDWDLQRMLWINEQNGIRAAPFLAFRTLLQLVEDEGEKYLLALPCITHGRYVDDIFGGADTSQELIETALQLQNLYRNQVDHVLCNYDTSKILGLRWNSQEDQFTFATTLSLNIDRFSKRSILSDIAKIFDPLSFVSLVVIKAKMLLQELWLHKIKWDDPIPQQLSIHWRAIKRDLSKLNKITIPRWLNTKSGSTVELHGFSDASQLAMAAVIYLTAHNACTNTKTILICSKTKVASLKRLSILQLELAAALLLSRLILYVKNTLNMKTTATYLWTDSRVTLTWIKSHASRWKDFVRNHVILIQETTSNYQWN
ncbi:PREDICTED: uncharacterized protein LOC105367040 [Ceratosolen solmsi marchali]|uniref:Uncharacterized protein LOC105367040 n=1 Tax=Ceratosolen solmsi marchali TaxID=326594 RepID=A0AAJ6YTD9_9HYME|nr:PREDICTED: uncharacterized protein LOC105367040 [Ceratosolen solmsi marchali]